MYGLRSTYKVVHTAELSSFTGFWILRRVIRSIAEATAACACLRWVTSILTRL